MSTKNKTTGEKLAGVMRMSGSKLNNADMAARREAVAEIKRLQTRYDITLGEAVKKFLRGEK
jgi:hypothetical protein